MDEQAPAAECRAAPAAAARDADLRAGAAAADDRAASKRGLDAVCLADIWHAQLAKRGWSRAASDQLPLCLADSTRATYNRYIRQCADFCASRGVDFPPSDSAVLADFLVHKGRSSDRPQSVLRCVSAALGAVYQACDVCDLTVDPIIARLSTAIVKSGTRAPMRRSCVMDIAAFVRMFRSWQGNDAFSVQQLRLKAITLLAIALMLRPSDIAPLARCYDSESGSACNVGFPNHQLPRPLSPFQSGPARFYGASLHSHGSLIDNRPNPVRHGPVRGYPSSPD